MLIFKFEAKINSSLKGYFYYLENQTEKFISIPKF